MKYKDFEKRFRPFKPHKKPCQVKLMGFVYLYRSMEKVYDSRGNEIKPKYLADNQYASKSKSTYIPNKKIKRTKKDLKLISKYDKKKEPFNPLTQDRKKELTPKTKKKDMIKFIDFKTVLNFGMYKGKKGKEVLKINKRYLLWMRKENICKFSRNMHEALDF